MRHVRSFTAVLALVALAMPAFAADAPKSNPAWEKMKSLVGAWQVNAGAMGPTSVTYRLVSNGSALMETMEAPGETEMITMYHPDGNAIMATHYCSMGNQPRMRASIPAGDVKSLRFAYLDATNLANANVEVMRGLVVTFTDADHFQQQWTAQGGGKEQTSVFEYTRKK
ncbi:MAG TPA: hypothetical protein VGK08_05840 [Thermoanaerobaculia bacterium]|jgi:hypothetical protein